MVNGLPLGPKAVKVFLDVVHESGTYLWRPTMDEYLDDCLSSFISWPPRKVVFENPPEATRQQASVGKARAAGVGSKFHTEKSGATTSKTPPEKSQSTIQVIFLLTSKSSCYIKI